MFCSLHSVLAALTESRDGLVNAHVVHLHGGVLALPGRQPPVPMLPEFPQGVARGPVPGPRVGRVDHAAGEEGAPHRHVENDVKLEGEAHVTGVHKLYNSAI